MPHERFKKLMRISLWLSLVIIVVNFYLKIEPSAFKEEFDSGFKSLEEDLSNYDNRIKVFSSLVTLLGASVALLIPFIQKRIEKEDKKKTDLRLVRHSETIQEYYIPPKQSIGEVDAVGKIDMHGFWYKLRYFRISIKNKGDVAAKNVEVSLERIDGRKDFIPVPLNWTHINSAERNISPGQTVYFDVFYVKKDDTDGPVIASPIGFHGKEMSLLNQGQNNLIIKLYQDNGKTRTIDLKIGVGKIGEDGFPLLEINDFYEK